MEVTVLWRREERHAEIKPLAAFLSAASKPFQEILKAYKVESSEVRQPRSLNDLRFYDYWAITVVYVDVVFGKQLDAAFTYQLGEETRQASIPLMGVNPNMHEWLAGCVELYKLFPDHGVAFNQRTQATELLRRVFERDMHITFRI